MAEVVTIDKAGRIVIPKSLRQLWACLPYFRAHELVDTVNSATCLKADAILISNDKGFDRISEAVSIQVPKTSQAIEELPSE